MKSRWNVLHLGGLALAALIGLQILWHAFVLPPPTRHFWPTLTLSILPLVPGAWIAFGNLRRGILVGGIVCLFYFCHGVSVAWDDSTARGMALLEIALSLIVIGALGWDARGYKRPRK
jgi:uncharacterized membrane protein